MNKSKQLFKSNAMKKLFLGAAVAASSIAFAQTYGNQPIKDGARADTGFGVKAGLNVSSMSGDTWTDKKAKPGFYAGVFYKAPIAEGFSVQPELIYTQYGTRSKFTSNLLNNTTEYNLNLGYIAVPVMFQYNFVDEFFIEAGPEFGFMVNANSKVKNSNDNIPNGERVELKTDDFNKFNFGIGIGLGYYFIPELGISARYVAGLNNPLDQDNDKWGSDAKSKNGTFQVGLNYRF